MKVKASSFIASKDHSLLIDEKVSDFKATQRFEFISKLSDESLINQCHDVYKKFKTRKHFVQVGIGGSALGPEMLVSALGNIDVSFTFFNNIDPEDTSAKLAKINLKEALFYVVSKSGGTAETLATFAIITNELAKLGVEQTELKDYFVFASDPKQSQLRELGNELQIRTLGVPPNIGGRFSVLTPVGLLPALFAGININLLCKSGYDYGRNLGEQEDFRSLISMLLTHQEAGYDQTVFMPYSSKLRDLSFWFVQLWAESLGKKNSNGKRIGLTPVPSYGATDQHSQMQLFMEGPLNKVMFLINIKSSSTDYQLSNTFNHPKLQKLSKYTLKNLMDSEFFGTLKALEGQKVPHVTFEVENLNEDSLAKLIVFFEYLTAVTGFCLNIDPFDQPGVEAGKIYSFEWLDNLL